MTHTVFVGTYTHRESQGVYSLSFDSETGALSSPTLAAEAKNPTYLALSPKGCRLYAVSESEAMAAAFAVESGGRLSPLQPPAPSHGKAPCHLRVEASGRALVVANYHTGVVASLALNADGAIVGPGSVITHTGSGPNPERQAGPHAHCSELSPDSRFVFACDLGLDKIYTYRLEPDTARLSPANPPFTEAAPGSGPRHLTFAPDGRHAFMITEMGATITAYGYDAETGALTPRDTQSTLDPQVPFTGENRSAAVRVHPNGRWVYGSNRGPDSLALFDFDAATGRLHPVEVVPSGGLQPRDFILSPEGRWLLAAHQDSDTIIVFRIDPATGRLTRTANEARVSMPVCLLFGA